jgi:hypothetical protein
VFIQHVVEAASGRLALAVQSVGGEAAWNQLVAETVASSEAMISVLGWVLVGLAVLAVCGALLGWLVDGEWYALAVVSLIIAVGVSFGLCVNHYNAKEPTIYLMNQVLRPL